MPERQNILPDETLHELLEAIPSATATSRKTLTARNRDYERNHHVFSYRLTDKEIGGQVAAIAESLLVPVDDVARAFAEVGFRAVREGLLPLHKIPQVPRRMTLYPTGQESWELRKEASWPREIPSRRKKRKVSIVEKKQRQREQNEFRVSYRWPGSVHEQLTTLCDQVFGKTIRSEGRKGVVLTVLFRFSIHAYESGTLSLQPEAVIANQRLKW